MNGAALDIYIVYAFPLDYPGHYVARKFENDKPTDWFRIGLTLDGVRRELPPGLVCMVRDPSDPPAVVESWF